MLKIRKKVEDFNQITFEEKKERKNNDMIEKDKKEKAMKIHLKTTTTQQMTWDKYMGLS